MNRCQCWLVYFDCFVADAGKKKDKKKRLNLKGERERKKAHTCVQYKACNEKKIESKYGNEKGEYNPISFEKQ